MPVHRNQIICVYNRTKGFCACGCGKWFEFEGNYQDGFGPEYHHVYWKSQYRKTDRNDSRNLVLLNAECHKKIHNGQNRELDKRLKAEADIRKPPEKRSKSKCKIPRLLPKNPYKYDKKKMQEYRKMSVESFKKRNDGLSPSQYAYRQQKLYLDKLKRDGKK